MKKRNRGYVKGGLLGGVLDEMRAWILANSGASQEKIREMLKAVIKRAGIYAYKGAYNKYIIRR